MNHRKSRRAHRLRFQTLERRNLLAGDVGHNFVEAEDVNLDGQVTAIDALNVINDLAVQANRAAEGETARNTTKLADVDNSGDVTAGDALRVINRLSQDESDAESLEDGVDQLASAILTEDLPQGMRPQTAEAWLAKLEERTDTPPERRNAFDRLDDNGDGELTEDEVSEQQWDRLSQADADQSGSVTADELKEARPDESDAQSPSENAKPAFDDLDANEDGSLTEDEVSEKAWNRISKADGNEDGAVTLEELQAAREDREQNVQKPSSEEVFAHLDANEDGQLTADEVTEQKWARISQADANDDGGVTLEELKAARHANEDDVDGPSGDHAPPAFDRLDVNGDGALSEDEVTAEAWTRLSAADANSDGLVTLEEIRASGGGGGRGDAGGQRRGDQGGGQR